MLVMQGSNVCCKFRGECKNQTVIGQLLIAQELMHVGKALAPCLQEYVPFDACGAHLAIPEDSHTPYECRHAFWGDLALEMIYF